MGDGLGGVFEALGGLGADGLQLRVVLRLHLPPRCLKRPPPLRLQPLLQPLLQPP